MGSAVTIQALIGTSGQLMPATTSICGLLRVFAAASCTCCGAAWRLSLHSHIPFWHLLPFSALTIRPRTNLEAYIVIMASNCALVAASPGHALRITKVGTTNSAELMSVDVDIRDMVSEYTSQKHP